MSTQIPSYEPPNSATAEQIEAVHPSSATSGDEDTSRPNRNVFLDTGTSVEDFNASSKEIAKLLKKI